ncbi:SOUL family heme-binding protein [Rhizorhabdus dicambivorans]|uniref:SOUL heme-binding protein n=1 Tax=Rhizorhabdus dicambivorans TaxID=1850238 RepID=A0A2A4FY04_9SPHN|nr:heme-binding protein [Rhizorhabdus dicambivorans]ATE65970.1 SOUL heme-binding protein [Rhizorhabdus dicambivorans]PCE43085.1 SOUL heme-binding protein [Rhizorhabdus dicambivorans]
MAKIGWGRILAGVATAAAAGAAYIYFKQRAARAPLHETLASEGGFEIRRYPALLVVETVQYGSRDRALGNGFGVLADYMFGEGREGEEIPITMPVLAEPFGDGGWRVRFLIPQGIARESLEPPGEGIAIAEIPAREVAVISVPGKPSDRLFSARTAELRRWIKARGRVAAGGPEHGYYNSPLKPGTALPNEVLIPLADDADGKR